MVRSIISLAITAAISALSAEATTVAVLELGKGGTLHKTSSSSPTTSTGGIMSFWKSTHDAGNSGEARKERIVQYPGMSVVPDLFTRATGGLVIGVTGEIDLDAMPTVASSLKKDGAIGHFHVEGKSLWKLMNHIQAKSVVPTEFDGAIKGKAKAAISEKGNKLESLSVNVKSSEDAAAVDASLESLLKSLAEEAEKTGSTIVVHLVVDDEKKYARRNLLSDENEERQLDGDNGDGDGNSYVIPGYYDDNNNFVTNYRTIFQIQYFNVVLWTAVGLFGILATANLMTMNMPLMPDTLLFGESAKMVAE